MYYLLLQECMELYLHPPPPQTFALFDAFLHIGKNLSLLLHSFGFVQIVCCWCPLYTTCKIYRVYVTGPCVLYVKQCFSNFPPAEPLFRLKYLPELRPFLRIANISYIYIHGLSWNYVPVSLQRILIENLIHLFLYITLYS